MRLVRHNARNQLHTVYKTHTSHPQRAESMKRKYHLTEATSDGLFKTPIYANKSSVRQRRSGSYGSKWNVTCLPYRLLEGLIKSSLRFFLETWENDEVKELWSVMSQFLLKSQNCTSQGLLQINLKWIIFLVFYSFYTTAICQQSQFLINQRIVTFFFSQRWLILVLWDVHETSKSLFML